MLHHDDEKIPKDIVKVKLESNSTPAVDSIVSSMPKQKKFCLKPLLLFLTFKEHN